jgi:hypothetical protein
MDILLCCVGQVENERELSTGEIKMLRKMQQTRDNCGSGRLYHPVQNELIYVSYLLKTKNLVLLRGRAFSNLRFLLVADLQLQFPVSQSLHIIYVPGFAFTTTTVFWQSHLGQLHFILELISAAGITFSFFNSEQ